MPGYSAGAAHCFGEIAVIAFGAVQSGKNKREYMFQKPTVLAVNPPYDREMYPTA
jgi:hypothetical protein